MRKRLAAESDSARKQIAELQMRARAAAAERDALLEKARVLFQMSPAQAGGTCKFTRYAARPSCYSASVAKL